MSAQPLTGPLTLHALPAPSSLLCAMELGPSNPALWAHESPSSGASSHEQPLSTAQPPGTYLGQLGRVGR